VRPGGLDTDTSGFGSVGRDAGAAGWLFAFVVTVTVVVRIMLIVFSVLVMPRSIFAVVSHR
jgi:hypothetical protein